ncbi:MAG: dCTP deaminase [Rickettsiales bacterium]|jgi:dCTP deaminase|nr:dCTP deaminase [Rickettsiales bacterium]
MMLSGKEIIKRMSLTPKQKLQRFLGKSVCPDILIEPYDVKCVGPNSYDIHLAPTMLVYENEVLDSKQNNPTKKIEIPEDGLVLQPGELYLGSTIEYTETFNLVPKIDGRSSIGRLGILVHFTAGFGDVGFCGTWTLEIMVQKPVKVYPGMRIGQLYYEHISKDHDNYKGHYLGQNGAVASRMNNKDNWQK